MISAARIVTTITARIPIRADIPAIKVVEIVEVIKRTNRETCFFTHVVYEDRKKTKRDTCVLN
jgi:uncharacterized protein YbaA (DUF1428 family)